MIEISQKEFESKIEDLISGKISRIKLAKVLETDIRTLNNKIIQEVDSIELGMVFEIGRLILESC